MNGRMTVRGILATAVILGLAMPLAALRAADPAVKAETGTIKGTVTGMDGKPAAKVRVAVMKPRPKGQGAEKKKDFTADPGATPPTPPSEPTPPQGGPGGPGGGKRPKPVAETMTEADGTFIINDVPVGEYMLWSGSREAGMAREPAKVEAGKTLEVKLTLKEPPQRGGNGGGGGGAK